MQSLETVLSCMAYLPELHILLIPTSDPPPCLPLSSAELHWYPVSQSWHSTFSVSPQFRLAPALGALTGSFGQCPSLFASPPRFGNPGVAGNQRWIRAMKSLSRFSLPLQSPPFPSSMARGDVVCSKTMEAFSTGLIWTAREKDRQTDRHIVKETS